MKIPEPVHVRTTAQAILKNYESQPQQNRPHLGASEIGKPCDRALWYSFRWTTKKKFSGRILRLFNTGIREESRFLDELKAIGAEVHERDENGKQFQFSAHGGHFGGSCDAVVRGLPEAPKSWAIVEMKTHSSKSFAELEKSSVVKAKPEHFAQMQVYMGLAEIDRALYLAVNKDTDELYSEWLHFDKEIFQALLNRAERIINYGTPPEKMSKDPAWYQCKFCDHQSICHQGEIPQKSCRTCAFSTPKDDGTWTCGLFKRVLPIAEQRTGCRSHLFIPNLISFAEPVDSGKDFVSYQGKNGIVFANVFEDADRSEENMGTGIVACFTSHELEGANEKVILNEFILEVKQMGGTLRDVELRGGQR
ncbi:MAG: oxidoreductase [Proteobacteria bacterium]|nr:oxidoreductase [Pseudomonadota bacterium]